MLVTLVSTTLVMAAFLIGMTLIMKARLGETTRVPLRVRKFVESASPAALRRRARR